MRRLILIFILISSVSFAQVRKLSLTDWKFKNTRDTVWEKASVPGTVHTDLLAAKLIEDPFFGTNEASLQWIENEDWEYTTTYTLSKDKNKNNCDIVFEGLDTYAEVFINGNKIISADNMFCEWRASCGEYLIDGENKIRVLFRSPIKIEDSLSAAFSMQTGIKEMFGGSRVFTRKAAYHYGWDWSPRFVTCGIWRPAYIEFFDEGKITDISTQQNIKQNTAIVGFRIETVLSDSKIITVRDALTNETIAEKTIEHSPSFINIEIKNPQLWWTNGLGEAYLYKYKIVLRDGKNTIEEKLINVGLRTIELIQDVDSAGSSFYFKLNGVPVFMKGANFIPPDNFLPRATKQKYSSLVKEAVNSNMNMLRVWGGGVYENDEFYNLCDENGILVWQDFMFACSMVPSGKDFAENVYKEAVYNVRRLRNHPCIAMWCGNNESDEGWNNWGWQNGLTDEQKSVMWPAYENIFKNILPSVVSEFYGNSNYVSTSPKNGWGRKESLTEGDSHYWGVWWGMEPFEVFKSKVGRFMSEYGFQGFPGMETIKNFAPSEERYLYSNSLKAHQKHPTGFETIQKYMEMYYNIPESLENYVSISQSLQAMGMKTAIEAHRRAKPYCMGTLYWQFNDCNPVISWSGIDYYGKEKQLQRIVKEAFADILVSPVEENGKIKIYIISDRLKETKGELELNVFTFGNFKTKYNLTKEVFISPNSSAIYYETDANDILKFTNIYTDYLYVQLKTEDGKTYINGHVFCKPKEFKIEK